MFASVRLKSLFSRIFCSFFLLSTNSIFAIQASAVISPENAHELTTTQFLSRGELQDLTYSPDSKTLAAMTPIGVWVFDSESPAGRLFYEEHQAPLSGIDWSPDGSLIAIGARDGVVRLIDARTGDLTGTLDRHEPGEIVSDMVFSPDGAILAASYNGWLRLWDVAQKTLINERETTGGSSNGVIFSPDGKLLAHSLCCEAVYIWDMPQFSLHYKLMTDGFVRSVAFSPDSSEMAVLDEYQLLHLWHPASGLLQTLQIADAASLVSYSTGGAAIVYGMYEGKLLVLDAQTGNILETSDINVGSMESFSLSPDGTRLAISDEETLYTFDYPSLNNLTVASDFAQFVQDIAVSPDESIIISLHLLTGIRAWNTAGETLYRLPENLSGKVLLSSNWSRMVSNERDGIHIRNPQTGESISTLQNSAGKWYSLEISPDGARAAAVASDYQLWLWDTITGNIIATTEVGYLAGYITFAPDGATFVTAHSDPTTLDLWNAKTLEKIASETISTQAGITDLHVAPDGMILTASLAGEKPSVLLLDAHTLKIRANMKGHTDWIITSAFSPDGTLLATGSRDGTLHLWDTQTGTEIAVLTGHTNWINKVAFSPNGKLLATASNDGTVRLWDVIQHTELVVLRGHTDQVYGLGFYPDGTHLITAGRDGAIHIWGIAS